MPNATLITRPWNGYGSFDFDVHLLDPSGDEVEKGEGNSDERQDDLSHQPARTGTYTVKIVSYRGAGRFVADVSAGMGYPPAGAPARCR